MRRLPLLAVLLTAAAVSAEDAPSYRGFRADLRASDAVLRLRAAGREEGRLKATVEGVFKGEGLKPGETLALALDDDAYEARLSGELDCPGGILGNGVHFFGKVPAAGAGFVALARKVDGKWVLDACCLAELTGGLSFTDAEQAKAYGEELRKAAERADDFVRLMVRASTAPDAEAALVYAGILASYFAAEGAGDIDLAVGIVLDDFRRVAAAVDRDNAGLREAVAKAHAFVLDGGAAKNAQASALREWLTGMLTLPQRREAAAYYAAEYRKARREAEDDEKRKREPKDPRKRPEPDRFEDTAARRFGLQSRLKDLPRLIAVALDPANPPTDLSNDELLERADSFQSK